MAQYPKLLELSEERETALKAHLDKILLEHDGERDPFIDDLIRMQSDYWAKPSTETRTFPFKGAANIIIPLTAIAFETVHARTMSQLFGLRQFVNVRATSPMFTEVATPFEGYFDHELKHSVKFKRSIEPSVIEIEKFGTGAACTHYETVVKWGVKEVAGKEEEFPVTTSRGAKVHSVPMARLMFPLGAPTIETASWIGEEHETTPYDLMLKEQAGLFYEGTYEALKFWYENVYKGGMRFTENQQELEKRVPFAWSDRVQFVELWLAFDVEDTGRQREIVVWYHRPTRMLMGVRNNWNFDLRRKYRVGIYFPVEHRITGIGIAKQNEQFQKEVTTQHRQRLDNATLANMRMIKISKLSGYGPNEPIFPGKMWFLDDLTQIDSIQMGEVYPSSFNNEQVSVQYSQQRTGVNEATLGMPQAGTPGTATADLQRVQEGKRKFDYTYGNIKLFVDDVLNDVLLNIAQFGPSSQYYFDTMEGGPLVRQFLSAPPELIKQALLLEIASAGEKDNNILDRQNWMTITQVLQQYYGGMIQLAQTLGSPQLMQLISGKALSSATEAVKQILESYELKNVRNIIIPELLNPEALFGALQQSQQMALPPGNNGAAGAGQTGGVPNSQVPM